MLKNFLDDIDQVQLPDDLLLNSLDCPMDGSHGIKSEHMSPEQHIKQESLTPMHMSPQRSDAQSPAYKPLITSDPLMASNFSPIPPMSSPSPSLSSSSSPSAATMIPTAALLQHTINRQQLPQQHSPSSMSSMENTAINATGNIILQANASVASPLQLGHLDVNNQTIALTQATTTMSTIPSILYATTAAGVNNNNAFILQTTAPNTINNVPNNETPEKNVQKSANPQNSGTTKTQQYKKIQSMPHVLTVQSIGTVGTANTPVNVGDKQQNLLQSQATIKVRIERNKKTIILYYFSAI